VVQKIQKKLKKVVCIGKKTKNAKIQVAAKCCRQKQQFCLSGDCFGAFWDIIFAGRFSAGYLRYSYRETAIATDQYF